MWQKLEIDSSTVYCRLSYEVTEIPTFLKGSDWIIVSEKFDGVEERNFESIMAPPDERNIEYFIDSGNQKVYISGYLADERLQERPIHFLAFSKSKIQIFYDNMKVIFDRGQFSAKFRLKNHFISLIQREPFNDSPSPPRKRYREGPSTSAIVDSRSSGSQEFGVYTGSSRTLSCMSEADDAQQFDHENSNESITLHSTESFMSLDHIIGPPYQIQSPKVRMCQSLMNFVNLTPSSLKAWTSKEVASVFGDILGKMTKQRLTFELCIHADLVDMALDAHKNGTKFGYDLIKETLRKFRANPAETTKILQEKELWGEDRLMFNKYAKVTPDLKFMLVSKHIDEEVSAQLSTLFENEPSFFNFVKGSDLRSVSKSNQKESIIQRYNLYKQKELTTENPAQLRITIDKNPTFFDVLITCDEVLKEKLLTIRDTIIVVQFGVFTPQSQIVHLPDELGSEDEDGNLINHASVNFFVKYEGETVRGKDLTRFLSTVGVVNKSVFNLKDLKPLMEARPEIFVDFGGLITTDFLFHIISNRVSLIVPNNSWKAKIMKKSNEIRALSSRPADGN